MAYKKAVTVDKEGNFRSRNIQVCLYPDNENHMKALEDLQKQESNFAYILHDKDTWTTEDEKKNPEHKAGELKKAHYHVILKYKNAVFASALSKKYNLESHLIDPVNEPDNYLMYLIHYNAPDKYQYSVDDVKGPLKARLNDLVESREKSEGEKVVEILDFIDSQKYLRIKDLVRWSCENGYYSELRRGASLLTTCVYEHNEEYKHKEENRLYGVKEYPEGFHDVEGLESSKVFGE